MRAGFRTVLSGLVLTFHAATGQAALSDWPEFRGPTGQGIAADATPPVEWNAEKNIAWKAELPGAGWSSPIVYGGAIEAENLPAGGAVFRFSLPLPAHRPARAAPTGEASERAAA